MNEKLPAPGSAQERQTTPNEYNYPPEYFGAQVAFARKWSEITQQDFHQTLLSNTTVHRAIHRAKPDLDGDVPVWLLEIDEATPDDEITDYLHRSYVATPHSNYSPPTAREYGALSYVHREDRQAVQLHFDNPERGSSPLSPENLPLRRAEFKQLLKDVREAHPEVTHFIAGSWLFSTGSFRSLFPENIDLQNIMRPDMLFGGDSLWGQFVDRSGNVNRRTYDQFLEQLQSAETIEDLLSAFPLPVRFTNDTIDKYYEAYDIGSNEIGISEFKTEPWGEDFSFDYYWKTIDAVQDSGYALHTVSEAKELIEGETRIGLIRHDIDDDPYLALNMARREAERGIRATYFVIPNTESYDITDPAIVALIQEIESLGHEVGLHYNPDDEKRATVTNPEDFEIDIAATATNLRETLNINVTSVSFHKPNAHPSWLHGELMIGGLVNAYAKEFMSPSHGALYATDSWGTWKFGEPIERIKQAGAADARVIQILTHAEWWHEGDVLTARSLGRVAL